ncbi:MAG: helix-turn-helix transcriptional regulator [Clostridia bacterium]|nr:helix-turn-helix transcriptional regulator [Clostridia bacterium]MBQ7043195.1 helix-turn-helix transcriptional regulator [Clostridia bacterium]
MAYFKRLRDLREDRDLTQKEVAEKLYMQTTQYRRYESGERSIGLDVAVLIADFYNVSVDYIAGVSDYNDRISSKDLTSDEKQLITYFRELSENNKSRLLERALTLTEK